VPSYTSIAEFVRMQPVIVLFLLLGCGYILGRVRIGGIALGQVAGTLLVSLVFGYFGFRISPGAQSVGFALFIFAIGYQAGPRFFGVLRAQGLQYGALALFVTVVAFVTAWLAGRLLHLPPGGTAGLFDGSLTSTPALAAAQEAVRSGIVEIPPGSTTERVLATIGSIYAITYLVGTLGVVAVVSIFPRLIGLDLAAEARRLDEAGREDPGEPMQARAYRVEREEFCRPTVAELTRHYWDGLALVRVRRGLAWLKPAPADHLHVGDEIYAYGDARFFRGGIDRAGPEIRILREMELSSSLTHVLVVRKHAVGQRLADLDLARKYGLVVSEVKRDGRLMPVGRDFQLARGDILTVVGPAWGLRMLPETLGPVEANLVETDMTIFAFGIAIGAALGLLSVTVAGIPLSLGMAGGLLLLGILAGWLNSTRPSVAAFPEAARWVLTEFGLLIFIAGVGLSAGGSVIENFRAVGPAVLVAAAFVVGLPLILGYAFGRMILKLNPVLLLGALTGAMTSAPGLGLVTREANSAVPALGYTGTYALAAILMTISGTLIAYL
jgi:putative transport protein